MLKNVLLVLLLLSGVPESIRLQISEDLCQDMYCNNLPAFWTLLGYKDDDIKRLHSGLQHFTTRERIQKMLECAPKLQSLEYSQALVKLIFAIRFANMIQLSKQLEQQFKGEIENSFGDFVPDVTTDWPN